MIKKSIPGFPGYYADRMGGIWSVMRSCEPRRLKPCAQKKYGHLFVRLQKDGKTHKRYVSRLILETFVGPCPRGKEGCHNNGIVTNNKLENLRWDTPSNNTLDSIKHGTRVCTKGEKHGRAVLAEADVIEIRRLLETGEITSLDLAKLYGIGTSTMMHIKHRDSWRHI